MDYIIGDTTIEIDSFMMVGVRKGAIKNYASNIRLSILDSGYYDDDHYGVCEFVGLEVAPSLAYNIICSPDDWADRIRGLSIEVEYVTGLKPLLVGVYRVNEY